MMMRLFQTGFAAALALGLFLPGAAQAAMSFHEVPWGMVKVDLNLDGESDLVVHTWPEDELMTEKVQIQFLIFDGEHEDGLRSVRIEGQDEPMFLLPAHVDGECKVYDFVLMATGRTRNTRRFDMVYMQRSENVDAEGNGAVTFTHYRLEKDQEEAVRTGGNPYIYLKAGEYTAAEAYCDVKTAFEENLDTLGETFEDKVVPKVKKPEPKKAGEPPTP